MSEDLSNQQRSITQLLSDWQHGDQQAIDKLTPLVYDELHRIANRMMRSEKPNHTLQPTALIHEAYIRIADAKLDWQNRNHFFAIAAKLIRQILVDHARRTAAQKRGGNAVHVTLKEDVQEQTDVDIMQLNQALEDLEKIDPVKASIVEQRYFGGLNGKEIAEIRGVSIRTVQRELSFARAWLAHEMKN